MTSTQEMTLIKPAETLGPVLTGRAQASELRERIAQAASGGETLVVDLEGVEVMSPSFADELFAKLAPEVEQGRVRFEHLTEDMEALQRFVVSGRSEGNSS